MAQALSAVFEILEPDRVEIVSRGEAGVGVECGGESMEQCDGGFGAAFFDALAP